MSKRKYTHMNEYEAVILTMRQSGYTRREIADELGLSVKQIETWITRYNKRQALLLSEKERKVSYYWIQLGILYRNSNRFEEAENAFEYAKNAHGVENYQIAHTTAKNYMEWGLWSTTNAPSQASVGCFSILFQIAFVSLTPYADMLFFFGWYPNNLTIR